MTEKVSVGSLCDVDSHDIHPEGTLLFFGTHVRVVVLFVIVGMWGTGCRFRRGNAVLSELWFRT